MFQDTLFEKISFIIVNSSSSSIQLIGHTAVLTLSENGNVSAPFHSDRHEKFVITGFVIILSNRTSRKEATQI